MLKAENIKVEATSSLQRLYNTAEAFYYAGILTSLSFNASAITEGAYRHIGWAAQAAITGQRQNELASPPIVNLAFSIELYIKLLVSLSNGNKPAIRGHDLKGLFEQLEKCSPVIAQKAVELHADSLGERDQFVQCLSDDALAFEKWRYPHEQEFIVSSPDALFSLCNTFRKTIRHFYPELRSCFDTIQHTQVSAE